MPRLGQRGRAASRAGAASQLEGSPHARSLPARMARDAAAPRERGEASLAQPCIVGITEGLLSHRIISKRSSLKCSTESLVIGK